MILIYMDTFITYFQMFTFGQTINEHVQHSTVSENSTHSVLILIKIGGKL